MSKDKSKMNVISGKEPVGIPLASIFPTFFIGLGGCGCEIVDHIMSFIKRSYNHKVYDNLVNYFVFDTDQDDLLSLKNIEPRYKFLLSDFPKGDYMDLKLGRRHQEPDPFFKSWWPEWYKGRPDSTKGAGQIRVESRLSMYYQLEDDRLGIIQRLREAISSSLDHDNPYRKARPASAYCYIFGSLAGGTGGGGFLTMAYLMRELLEERRLSPVMSGIFLLSSLFYAKVKSKLIPDIQANSYASLKELEYFMTLGYNRNPRELAGRIEADQTDHIIFNYNPFNKQSPTSTNVKLPPFNTVFLIDEPAGFSFSEPKQIYPAIAAASYVQLFSQILGERESEEDNYYKKLKALDSRGFSLGYGSFGLSMFVMPENELIQYCAKLMTTKILDDCVGNGEKIDTRDVKTRAAAFVENTDEKVRKRAEPTMEGFKRHVEKQIEAATKDAVKANQRLKEKTGPVIFDREDRKQGFENVDLDSPITSIRKYKDKIENQCMDAIEKAEKKAQDPENMNKLLDDSDSEEFKKFLLGWAYGEADANGGPVNQKSDLKPHVDNLDVFCDEHFKSLNVAKKMTLTEKITGDRDFIDAAEKFNHELQESLEAAEKTIKKLARRTFYNELKRIFGENIKEIGQQEVQIEEQIKQLKEDAENLREEAQMVGSNEVSQAHEYVLDVEVLQGLFTKRRHWDRFYDDYVIKEYYSDDVRDKIYNRSESEFRKGSSGKELRDVIEAEVYAHLAKNILGRRRSGDREKNEMGIDIFMMLKLEAEYELCEQYISDHEWPQKLPGDRKKEELEKIRNEFEALPEEIETYIGQKIEFCARKAQILARLRSTETLAVDPMNFIAVHSMHVERIRDIIKNRDIFKNLKILDNWNDERRIAFFNAQVGLPVHNFYPVTGEFREAYERIYKTYVQTQDFPSHIDRAYEEPYEDDFDARLPGLDPSRLPRVRESSMTSFLQCLLTGMIEETDKSINMTLADKKMTLATAGKTGGRIDYFRAYLAFRKKFYPERTDIEKYDQKQRDQYKDDRTGLDTEIEARYKEIMDKSDDEVRKLFVDLRGKIRIRREKNTAMSNLNRHELREQHLLERLDEMLNVVEKHTLLEMEKQL